jgi:hypothetical protein
MPSYEISWTIGLQTNDGSVLEIPYSETALSEMYPPVNQGEGVDIRTSTDGGHQGQISMSQRVFSGDAKTARMYLIGGNAFASQDGMVAVINNTAIDVCVSSLTVVNIENGTSVVMDGGFHVPDTVEAAPATGAGTVLRRRRGRPRRSAVADEPTMEAEEEVTEEAEEEVTEEAEEEVTEEAEEESTEEAEEEVTEEEDVVDNATTEGAEGSEDSEENE